MFLVKMMQRNVLLQDTSIQFDEYLKVASEQSARLCIELIKD